MKAIINSVIVFIISISSICFAETNNIIYINGIQNTYDQFEESRLIIRQILALSANHTNQSNRIRFNVFGIWNPIGFAAELNSLGYVKGDDLNQDLKELFILKTAEEHFANDFRLILAPHNTQSLVDKTAATRVLPFLDDMTPGDNSLESGDTPLTDVNMEHTRTAANALYGKAKSLGSAVIVAHSQGNLLANLAYARLVSDFGNDIRKKVMIVNIANTSQFSANNLNISHAGDRALYKNSWMEKDLNTLATQKKWLRTTPLCNNAICDFTLATPTLGAVDIGGWDTGTVDSNLQHSITSTYLSDFIVPTILDEQGVTLSNLTQRRFVDIFEDFVYTAANAVNRGIYIGNILKGASIALPADNCFRNDHYKVVDGDLDTSYPICDRGASIPIDLGKSMKIKKLIIRVQMPIEGAVTYEITSSGVIDGWHTYGVKTNTWKNNQDIEIDLSKYDVPISSLQLIVYDYPSLIEIKEIQGFL